MTNIERKELLNLCNKYDAQEIIVDKKQSLIYKQHSISVTNEKTLMQISKEKFVGFAVWKQLILWFIILCIFIAIDAK